MIRCARLQIGIAGVMAVLLLVGLAGLIGDRAREQAAGDAVAANPAATGETEKGSGAPLEELGVQPVTPTAGQPAAAAPAAVKTAPLPPTTAKVPDLEPDPALQRARNKSGQ
ncbi:hypothetical protein [Sphingopyxis sp. PET50]|uniref:hypothetical protein n=1 Tax=Sphingopyxis sp. PET50 TaxID=2976533 RepID=UPI0021AEDE3B|nr:hypothetical protein [Sphingopyxis sp. PET50]